MPGKNCDILVQIPDQDLPKLEELYAKKAPWAPYMVGLVQTAIKWRQSEKYKNCVRFMSPNNCWAEDGTIIAIITVYRQDVFLFTLDDRCVNLYKGLMETQLLDYGKRTLICAVHEKHTEVVKKYIEEKQIPIIGMIPNFFYAMSPEDAKNLKIDCPAEVYVEKIGPSAAKQIDDVWPFKFENSEKYVAAYLEMNGGYGVFLKSTNEMVAWVIKHTHGHLGMLQTEEKHKRKGYAGLVTKMLSKEIGEAGQWPLGTILENNSSSVGMFEKLGFKCIGRCTFMFNA